MRWVKHILMVGLLLAAGVVTVGALFGDHADDYGTVGIPSGGIVHLPKGTVTVFYTVNGSAQVDTTGGLGFQAIPAAGGNPVPMSSPGGVISAEGTQRSEVIGQHGAIAKLDVPADGMYRIAVASNLQPGTADLQFGTTAEKALAAKWKLLAVLVGLAFLLALIPTPKHRRRSDDGSDLPSSSGTPTEWSSTPRAPYAG